MATHKVTRKIIAIFILCIFSLCGYAQEKVEASASIDIVSRYIYRGLSLGDASIQPKAEISYKGVKLLAWGSFDFLNKKSDREFDLMLSYSTGGFNIGVTDYYLSYYAEENTYFEYRSNKTSHAWEANIGYDFGPVAIQWFTNFAGNDGVNNGGKRAYSSFVEISAPFKLADCDWLATVGTVPYATDLYEADGFAITNVSLRCTKEIALFKKSLPIFVEGISNPNTKKGYLVVGATVEL